MSFSEICKILQKYLLYFAGMLLLPLTVAILYDFFIEEPFFETSSTVAFLKTMGISLALALIAAFFGRKATNKHLQRKEGIFFVVMIWFLTTALASLPFQFTGTIPNPIDAYYETMSGLTTTGCSILQGKEYDAEGHEIPITSVNPLNPSQTFTYYGTVPPIRDSQTGAVLYEGVEALGKPLLFWRSFLQWLGGVGIVVLFITVLPALGVGGKFLYESEMPGLTKEGMTPHIRQTAEALWKIYVGLTIAQIILHIVIDPSMSLFDAMTLSFSTISTGGFCVHNEGLPFYQNASVSWITGFFMILGGISFALYYHCFRRKFHYLRDPEFYGYLIILFIGCLLMSWSLLRQGGYTLVDILAYAPFQAISAISTTGFEITDYTYWPLGAQFLMILLMYIGGMSGSAVGGLKIIRLIIVFKGIFFRVQSFFRPGIVQVMQVGGKEVSRHTEKAVFTFFCSMFILSILGGYLLILDNNDPMTSLGVLATSVTNCGLLFGGVGCSPSDSFGFLSNFSKIVSLLWMLLGRLEFFSILVLLVPSFWRNR